MTESLQFRIRFPKFGFEKSFSFTPGLHVIYGESGCGKSHFIDQIINRNTDLDNFVLLNVKKSENIQKVYQNPDTQIISSTIDGELAFSLECRIDDSNSISQKVNELINDLQFEFNGERHPSSLSGGEKEMLNIVTAFSVDPSIVLIDDGLSFLNSSIKNKMVDYIQSKIDKDNIIVIWMTSDVSDFHYGDSDWELTLSSLKKWSGNEKPLTIPKRIIKKTNIQLSTHQLSFQYVHGHCIFKDVNLFARNFYALGLTGSNGSGKTTFAKLLLGIEKPVTGTISIIKNERSVSLAYLEQFPERLVGADTLKEFVDRLVIAGKLNKHMVNHGINNLSQCQINWDRIKDKTALDLPWSTLRFALTIWLLNCNYDLLILDEPTFGLGRDQVITLSHYLQLYLRNKHLIVISHDYNFISKFCDQVYDLDNRKIIPRSTNIETNGRN